MRDEIYQTELLKLAARARGAGRLEDPDLTARVDNPLCGDRVTVDLRLGDDRRIAAIGFEVRACMLCQAAASVLGEHAPGCSAAEVEAVGGRVEAMLKADEAPDASGAGEFRPFIPVRGHKSRYECVLLPFKAIGRAFSERPEGA